MAVGPAGPEPADETQVHPGRRYCNDYERTKAVADALAREAAAAGADVVMLYPGVVYGPGELTDGNLVVQMIADHLRGRLPGVIGPGDRLWSYAFVDDVALGHALALERGKAGERYFLCGENATLLDLFSSGGEATRVAAPTPPHPLSRGLASWAGSLWLWADVTGHPPLLTHGVVERLPSSTGPTPARRRSASSATTSTPLAEGRAADRGVASRGGPRVIPPHDGARREAFPWR